MAEEESGQEKTKAEESLAFSSKDMERHKEKAEVLKDRDKAIKYYLDQGDANGQFIQPEYALLKNDEDVNPDSPLWRRAQFVRNMKQWHNKVYIYICVGGDFQPKPEDSYPTQDRFENFSFAMPYGYDVGEKEGKFLVGFTARHEAFHYNPDGEPNDEYHADHGALDSITEAFDYYKESGDSSKFAFVFASKRGLLITNKEAGDSVIA